MRPAALSGRPGQARDQSRSDTIAGKAARAAPATNGMTSESSNLRGAGSGRTLQRAARDFRSGHLRQRGAAVRRAAHVYEDGTAATRRRRRGVVGCAGLLPDRPACRLRLCASDHAPCARAPLAPHPHSGQCHRLFRAAAAHRAGLRSAAAIGRGGVAARPVRDVYRAAVLCARSQWPAVAGMVRADEPPGREGSLFFICCEQCRKFPCARLLSGCDRAVHPARAADLALDRGLLSPDCLGRSLRRVDAALSRHRRAG